jgi:hypothetical protein
LGSINGRRDASSLRWLKYGAGCWRFHSGRATDVAVAISEEITMHALRDFLTTDYGIMSLVVLLITLGMATFYVRYFIRHMRQDEEAERARLAAAGAVKHG